MADIVNVFKASIRSMSIFVTHGLII